jgi:hypothetical protein
MHDGGPYSVSWSNRVPPQVVQNTDMLVVTIASVQETVGTLYGVAQQPPVLTGGQLDALSGAQVFLKCKCFQRGGAAPPGDNVEGLRPCPCLDGTPTVRR